MNATKIIFYLAAFIVLFSLVECGPSEDEAFELLRDHFNVNRYPRKGSENENREKVQNAISKIFRDAGLDVEYEEFETSIFMEADTKEKTIGKNIIGLMKGNNWMTGNDKIMVIGAHYDTDVNSKGVNDNGSGVVAMIQIIRRLRSYVSPCKFNNTIIFVAFDISSKEYIWQNARSDIGSHSFITQYLVPKILKPSLPTAGPTKFKGTIILDSILNYDNGKNSQSFPDGFVDEYKMQYNTIAANRFAGNFLLIVKRPGRSYLEEMIQKESLEVEYDSQNHDEAHQMISIDVSPDLFASDTVKRFTQQDHVSFWKHSRGLDTILLTDTGDLRGFMKKCYHSQCDDIFQVKPAHLRFLTHTVKVLTNVLKANSFKHCSDDSGSEKILPSILVLFSSIIWKILN